MIACSIDLMPTASLLMFSTQAASQGAGQTRPVNSGKLLVECSTSIASFQPPRYTRSFQSGMMLLTGQPLWQNGMPQSMQRAPCCLASASDRWPTNSLKWCRRDCGASAASNRRWNSRKPVILPMVRSFSGEGWVVSAAADTDSCRLDRAPACARGPVADGDSGRDLHRLHVGDGGLRGIHRLQHASILARHHAHEPAAHVAPVGQDLAGAERAGVAKVPLDQVAQQFLRRTRSRWRAASPAAVDPIRSIFSRSTIAVLQRFAKSPSLSSTYATPPDMPAAKLRPVCPSTTTVPPVMYSQP